MSNRQIFVACLAVSLWFSLVGNAAAVQESETSPNRISLTVLDEDGEPLPNTLVDLKFFSDASSVMQSRSATVEDNGNVTFLLGDEEPRLITYMCFSPGKVAWRSSRFVTNDTLSLPFHQDVVMESGRELSGVVKDDSGSPIPHAKVYVSMLAQEAFNNKWNRDRFTYGEIECDESGKFVLPAVSEDEGLNVRIVADHPDYLGPVESEIGSFEDTVALPLSARITGTVVGAKGKPLAGARLHFANNVWGHRVPTATTNERGEYELKGCWPGTAALTVQADGYSPVSEAITTSVKGETKVDFRLETSEGKTGVVVDQKGQPVAGALVRATEWQGQDKLRWQTTTDLSGRFTWSGSAKDTVNLSVFAKGYLTEHDIAIEATETEFELKIWPEVVLSGKIVDAESGDPVEKANVFLGSTHPETGDFVFEQSRYVSNPGDFEIRFIAIPESYRIQVRADDYRKTEIGPLTKTAGLPGQVIELTKESETIAEQAWRAIEGKIDESEFGMDAAVALTDLRQLGADIHHQKKDGSERFRVTLTDQYVINSAMHGVPEIKEQSARKTWKGDISDLASLNELEAVALILDGLEVSPELLEILGNIESLTSLNLDCVWRLDEEFTGFGKLQSLKTLVIDNGWQKFPTDAIDAIAALPNLEEFEFQRGSDHESVADDFAKRISQFPALKRLSLSGEVSMNNAGQIARNTALEKLHLMSAVDTEFVQRMGVQPNLKALRLKGPGISDEVFATLSKQFPNLEELMLFQVSTTGHGASILAQRPLRRLKLLQFPGCDRQALVDLQHAHRNCQIHLSYRFATSSMSSRFSLSENEQRPMVDEE